MVSYIGFDSAWTDNPKAPGAICAVSIKGRHETQFYPPKLVSFDQALTFIRSLHRDSGTTLVALDQPTVVANSTGMRPVERVAASLISWLGGGVQPSNRGRLGMFCDASPIWSFLSALGAVEDPERARTAAEGLHLMEVFPALALASLGAGFFGRLAAPRYNPARRKTFRVEDWVRVAQAAAHEAQALGCEELARWCRNAASIERPLKADQDKMDCALCVLIALRWRLRPRAESLLLGDLATGYMVLPASPSVRDRLTESARKLSVPIDGDGIASRRSLTARWAAHEAPELGSRPMTAKLIPAGNERRSESVIEIRDHVLWITHIRGNPALQNELLAMIAGSSVVLKVDGLVGRWVKMNDSKSGASTPGLKPTGQVKDHWQMLFKDRRGATVEINKVGSG
jgi:predicted RNase H-like nuclease